MSTTEHGRDGARSRDGWIGDVTVIGGGRIGGKAEGLVRIAREVLTQITDGEFPEFSIRVPGFTVIGTDVFDDFMRHNDLEGVALSGDDDERIAHAFQRGVLPAQHLGALRDIVRHGTNPLAVRSSSLLEDALDHPFAGVYATKMTPNNQPSADARFRRLQEAVKFVYASTFFRSARTYLEALGREPRDEKMAVIIQEVVGRRHGDRFYPTISSVARTYNYYPAGKATPHDGVASLALGLGRQIVDGGACWSYVPAYPLAPPPYADVGERLNATQRTFWAVNVGKPPAPDPVRETEYLVECPLEDAEYDGSLDHVVSTYLPANGVLRPGRRPGGPWCVDFSPMLGLGTLPLNGAIQRLLALSEQATGGAVEIELALDIPHDDGEPARLGFLQMRPMAVSGSGRTLTADDLRGPDVVVAAQHALGDGVKSGVVDVVYVDPATFDAGKTTQVALELAEHNRRLLQARRPYVLIGFGRWGTSDPWLGIPVDWGRVSGACVLVEAALQDEPRHQPGFALLPQPDQLRGLLPGHRTRRRGARGLGLALRATRGGAVAVRAPRRAVRAVAHRGRWDRGPGGHPACVTAT
ncbi:MAG: PEP/pyruvate-binding domain-containing protein [Candidatus Krumholzibacteriia bacterium]